MRASLAAVLVLSVIISSDAAGAQPKQVELRKVGVDCVTLHNGPRLLGALVDRDAKGALTLAVRREWLKETHPAFYKERHDEENNELSKRATGLPQRIRKWTARRAADEDLVRFLKAELSRVEKALKDKPDADAAVDSEFMLVKLPADRLRFVFRQPAERRQIALISWRERLADVETRSAPDLLKELQGKGIKLDGESVDLSGRLPKLPDDDRQWAARQAIVEYEYRRRLDFQGTGDLLFPTGDAAARPDLGRLMTEMLQSQLGKELADLLGPELPKKPAPKREFDTAKTLAEKDDVRGFRVTRVDQNLTARRVTVESRFLVRMPDGKWETIWKSTETADATKKRAAMEDRITKDPNVRKVFQLLGTLTGDAQGGSADIALKFAAATMETQQHADNRFLEFRRRYDQQIAGPPLRWSGVK